MQSSSVEVAIVGTGPYGLALAAHLLGRGIEFRIFGTPMQSWHEMPPGMFLKSETYATSISDPAARCRLSDYCASRGLDGDQLVSMDDFVGYGRWFQRELVPNVEDVYVTRIAQAPVGFELELATGERLHARNVVVATGINYFAFAPAEVAGLPADLSSHTAHHRNLDRFAGQDVTVLGGGQSALQTAALLHEQGAQVRVLVRKQWVVWNPQPTSGSHGLMQRLRYPASGLGTGRRNWVYEHAPWAFHFLPSESRANIVRSDLGPAGAWWLRDRVVDQFPVLTGCTIRAAERDGAHVRLQLSRVDDGDAVIQTDHVISGTGFQVDLDRLTFIDLQLRSQLRRDAGSPALSTSFEASVPGMYFVGLPAAVSFGPMLRFVLGTSFASRRIGRHLAWKRALSAQPHAASASARPSPAMAVAEPASRAS